MNVENKLKEELYQSLKQGDKIRFKWWSNDNLVYIGRIEIDNFGEKYFINESNYQDNILLYEGMRYYNRLMDFGDFTEFELLNNE